MDADQEEIFLQSYQDAGGNLVTLTREQIEQNAKTYFDQASLVLDRERTEIRNAQATLEAMKARLAQAQTGAKNSNRTATNGSHQRSCGLVSVSAVAYSTASGL